MLHRAHTLWRTKTIDSEQRVICGRATAPEADRLGDEVMPRGARYTLPLPLLWQHKHDMPIGHVVAAIVTDRGIDIEAKIAKVDEPGPLRDRIETAWQEIRHKLIGGLSIGFRALRTEPIVEKGAGTRFLAWEWLECSTVTIPAAATATISMVKMLDNRPLSSLPAYRPKGSVVYLLGKEPSKINPATGSRHSVRFR